MLEGGREKFLVFAHHKLVLDHITAELEKKVGKTHGYIVPRRPDGMRNVNEVVLLWESLESSLGSAFFPPLIALMLHNDFISLQKMRNCDLQPFVCKLSSTEVKTSQTPPGGGM